MLPKHDSIVLHKKGSPWLLGNRSLFSLILILALASQPKHQTLAKKSIPHSKQSIFYKSHPAWNHSPEIDTHGFLSKRYKLHPGSWEKEARIGGKYGYKSLHTRKLPGVECVIRQVPGDGNCLFHSISTALSWVEDRRHLDFDETFQEKHNSLKLTKRQRLSRSRSALEEELDLHTRSKILRQIAVDMLDPRHCTQEPLEQQQQQQQQKRPHFHFNFLARKRRKPLFLQGSEFLRPNELLNIACSQYGLTAEEYCESMRKDGVWGGGPDLVALCNYLKRPIHVFELMTFYPKSTSRERQMERRRRKRNRNQATVTRGVDEGNEIDSDSGMVENSKPEFRLRRMACFGSPKFDYREPLHILSADCRFPDLQPGQQASAGNHFMVIFPERRGTHESMNVASASNHSRDGVRVRSGGRVRSRSESTFAKREVISKYLPRDHLSAPSIDRINGIVDKMKKLMSVNGNFESSTGNVDGKGNDVVDLNPLVQLKRWYDKRCDALGFVF